MSQQSSLRGSGPMGKHRNVLKRTERVKRIIKEREGALPESVLGLPKLKSIKMKGAK